MFVERRRQFLAVLLGPAAFALTVIFLRNSLGYKESIAVATIIWMALWWILRPVNISVTALLPIVINAVFELVPMAQVIGQYFSETIILLFGADIICLTWHSTGLDTRLSIKTLCLIGTSMKQQIAVWLMASAFLSMFLPNVVVCTILVPIAAAMLRFIGEENIANSKIATPILLAVVWGAGIGGMGTPIGAAANLVAVNYIEGMTGHEFMYIDWVMRFFPFLLIIIGVNLLFLFSLKLPVRHMQGTKSYFLEMQQKLGKMKTSEIISLILFLTAAALAFLRPLYADMLPGMKPAYVFLALSLFVFIFRNEQGKPLMTWEQAEEGIMWGMLFLFAGGLALGKLVTETGAAVKIAEIIAKGNLTGGLGTVFLFVLLACVLSEVSSNSASAAIVVPVIASIAGTLGLDAVPYLFITIVAFNCAYILPVSIRAIPVGYGLSPAALLKEGSKLAAISMLTITIVGYLAMKFWPLFSTL